MIKGFIGLLKNKLYKVLLEDRLLWCFSISVPDFPFKSDLVTFNH